ncbi:MAG: alpha/beta fold hydrolase [Chromatiaceae bacterium]|nr:MAG: alpha/beta fold hydrolase [Chromatiaceae bacterium]
MSQSSEDRLHEQLTAPLRLALEARAGWEFGALLASVPLLSQAPAGDGHPVLVLPRMLGSDLSTQPLRTFLNRLGYAASPWGQGLNLGPRAGVMAACRQRLESLQRIHGKQVSLIGWSLGGLFARQLAKEVPEAVRCLIGLGTPLHLEPSPAETWRLYEMLTGDPMELDGAEGLLEGSLLAPPPVPTTSIYSRTDGVVPWRASLESEGPQTENIEVESSHLGLVVNPLVLYVIADRLAQPEGAWRPFERTGLKAILYREPMREGW